MKNGINTGPSQAYHLTAAALNAAHMAEVALKQIKTPDHGKRKKKGKQLKDWQKR